MHNSNLSLCFRVIHYMLLTGKLPFDKANGAGRFDQRIAIRDLIATIKVTTIEDSLSSWREKDSSTEGT